MRSALTAAAGFDNLKTDLKSRTATFTCKNPEEIKKKLSEIAAKNKHVKDFEIQGDKKDDKKTSVEKPAKAQLVSLKLPNMT